MELIRCASQKIEKTYRQTVTDYPKKKKKTILIIEY